VLSILALENPPYRKPPALTWGRPCSWEKATSISRTASSALACSTHSAGQGELEVRKRRCLSADCGGASALWLVSDECCSTDARCPFLFPCMPVPFHVLCPRLHVSACISTDNPQPPGRPPCPTWMCFMYACTTGSPYSPIKSFTSAMPLVLAATCGRREL